MMDYAFHAFLLQQAGAGTGFIRTNAGKLAKDTRTSRKVAQKYLSRLERGGYIKRFAIRRSRSLYPIAVNRYICSNSPHRGMMLNATLTTDWRNPVYEPVSRGGHKPVSTAGGKDRKERARGEVELKSLENKTKIKSRPQPPRAPAPTPFPVRTETEQRRIVAARDNRLQKEAEVRIAVGVGVGPRVGPDVEVCCIECHASNPTHWGSPWEMGWNQFHRCDAKGRPPRGPQSSCPRHPRPVSTAPPPQTRSG
jgi:hypothetical protein